MNPGAENFSVREAEALRPRLRDGLRFSIQEENNRRVCVIEDPAASRFHRVGLGEYRFIRALDGTRPVAGILAEIAREGGAAFTQAEALQILGWLKDQHLLAIESARAGSSELEQGEQAMRAAMTWLNPLVVKVPLFRPDRFFTACERVLRPALGWGGFFVWLVVMLVGVAHVGMDWRRFNAAADGFFSRDNWLWLFVAWAGLKVAHEFSHGIFCKRFGAAVREAGVIFVVFFPMGYVDATASLGLASRWRRIMVAAAGLYMEFFLAAFAAIIWARTAPGALNTLAYDAVIMGTVLTFFFNANPLMRFDGYFILSDLLQVPNLSTRGGTWLRRALTWLLLGAEPARALRPTTREGWIVAALRNRRVDVANRGHRRVAFGRQRGVAWWWAAPGRNRRDRLGRVAAGTFCQLDAREDSHGSREREQAVAPRRCLERRPRGPGFRPVASFGVERWRGRVGRDAGAARGVSGFCRAGIGAGWRDG